ncbi:uncharacterized protein LDX57_009555 [Aspergillus melleus]|uniref:uncharacterized protein n=1 Tax=Aspergillus melleus TaxID=138277 RepID=UPI001E8DD136|nr:uncharacterized protein LDX57_009555 [Aspergillus melleus]KAH8431905.1 hypothetical protein LDX57_009555 [Aspergillus melleus]
MPPSPFYLSLSYPNESHRDIRSVYSTSKLNQSTAATGNCLFNFALGLSVLPGFADIKWKLFIVFGVLCVGAALQVFFTYPETCNKTLEEVEEMFGKDGPKPWHTKPGESKLDGLIEEAREKNLHAKDVGLKTELQSIETVEKGQ